MVPMYNFPGATWQPVRASTTRAPASTENYTLNRKSLNSEYITQKYDRFWLVVGNNIYRRRLGIMTTGSDVSHSHHAVFLLSGHDIFSLPALFSLITYGLCNMS